MNAATNRPSDPALEGSVPPTMRAVVQDRYGSPEVLRIATEPVPEIRPDEVLLRVEAAGIDRGTWHLLHGLPLVARAESGLRRPKRRIPGFDAAGTVVRVGSAVEGFAIGDAVCGIAKGSFAEYAAARAKKLAHRPADVDPTLAGALAVSGETALQAVRDRAHVGAGDRVLVLGASGGVGTYAVQIAVARGAHVTGVCSAAKADLVRALGAEKVVDYAVADALDGHERYDAIIDIGGRRPLRHLRRALAPGGRAVLVGGEGGGRVTGGFPGRLLRGALLSLLGRPMLGFVAKEDGQYVADLLELVRAGSVTPQVDAVVDLDGVARAIDDLEAGRVRGKVAVRP